MDDSDDSDDQDDQDDDGIQDGPTVLGTVKLAVTPRK